MEKDFYNYLNEIKWKVYNRISEEYDIDYYDIPEALDEFAFLNVDLLINYFDEDHKIFYEIMTEDSWDSEPFDEKYDDTISAIHNSYVSVYTGIGIKGGDTLLHDDLLDINIACKGKVLKKGQVALLRLIDLNGIYYCFSGPYPVADEDIFYSLIEHFSIPEGTNQTLILREYSSSLLAEYTRLTENIAVDSDTHALYDEITAFENSLNLSNDNKKILSFALIEFYDSELAPLGFNLKDIDKIDVRRFLLNALDSRIIRTKKELNIFIDAFKYYLEFLLKKDSKYLKIYNSLTEVSENRFIIMEKFKLVNELFPSSAGFNEKLEALLYLRRSGIEADFDTLIVYFTQNDIRLTPKGNLNREALADINDILIYSQKWLLGNGNQGDFPVINFMMNFGFEYNIFEKKGKFVKATPLSVNWLRLSRIEKIYAMANYLLGGGYWETLKNEKSKMILSEVQILLCEFIRENPIGEYYLEDLTKDEKYFFLTYNPHDVVLFEGLGLITISADEFGDTVINLDEFSKLFLEYFSGQKTDKSNVVPLRK